MDQPGQYCPSGSNAKLSLSLRRSASAPSICPRGDTPTKQLAAIERLEELHYDEVARLQATLSGHAKELSYIRSRLAKATSGAKLRKKSAKERAQSRDAEIISPREELANQKQCNNTIKNRAAEAEKAMVDMQQHGNYLTLQLNSSVAKGNNLRFVSIILGRQTRRSMRGTKMPRSKCKISNTQ
ncbi:hypothetical protein D8B26_005367 [Coccidioides posadasii str. Silveira]|nr:hypothetical protein D8B26_005367 [Coccidioides posadasii str. Silveira]